MNELCLSLASDSKTDVKLTTSVWVSLFQTEPYTFNRKTNLTIMTILRDIKFFSYYPNFSDDSLSLTDILHPNEQMCRAMHARISKNSLSASEHLKDDSRDELHDTFLRIISLIVYNKAYLKWESEVPKEYAPMEGESMEGMLDMLDVTLDCLLQIVAKRRAQRTDTTWSDSQKLRLVMLTTNPLFDIHGTKMLRDISNPVRRRVFLKTISLIGLVCNPTDPFPQASIPFRYTMMRILLQMYLDSKGNGRVEGWRKHKYRDIATLLFYSYDRGEDLAYEAVSTMDAIPGLCRCWRKGNEHSSPFSGDC